MDVEKHKRIPRKGQGEKALNKIRKKGNNGVTINQNVIPEESTEGGRNPESREY